MKFEMNGDEFNSFCAQLVQGAHAVQTQKLETELREVRSKLLDALEEHDNAWNQSERANAECQRLLRINNDASNEISRLKTLVEDLQDKLEPNRKERGLSRAFGFFRDGKMVKAIKEIRTIFNIGLKEAKDCVEGNFHDERFPELVDLSGIFACTRTVPVVDLRAKLIPHVSCDLSNDNLDKILMGTFYL